MNSYEFISKIKAMRLSFVSNNCICPKYTRRLFVSRYNARTFYMKEQSTNTCPVALIMLLVVGF